MRKNRKTPQKMNVFVRDAARIGAVLLVLLVMVLINIMATSSREMQLKAIGTSEKQLAQLEAACNRASAAWEQMKTPENIAGTLIARGLAMRPARADQSVYMNADGTVREGQYSLQRYKRQSTQTAMYNGRLRR